MCSGNTHAVETFMLTHVSVSCYIGRYLPNRSGLLWEVQGILATQIEGVLLYGHNVMLRHMWREEGDCSN